MNLEDLKKKIIDHDKEINYKEIESLEELKKKLKEFLEKAKEIEAYLEKLELINISELSGKNHIKEDELEILYKVYSLYSNLSSNFSEFYKKLLEYYILLKKEII